MPRPAPFRPLRALLLPLLLLGACQAAPQSKSENAAAAPAAPDAAAFTIRHPAWARHATIYQVNVRQYTAQGTFRAAETDLPRLRKMGVGILWLMPINPIGRSHRKGTLGSAYSVRDYRAVNPELGTLAGPAQTVIFERSKGPAAVVVMVNLSDKSQQLPLPEDAAAYRTVLSTPDATRDAATVILAPHGYQVWEKLAASTTR